MTRRRKTKAERNQEWAEAEHRAWEQFRPKLEALTSFAEAKLLVNEAPSPDSLGRSYYSNLGFFLGDFSVPAGSNYAEKALYVQFIQRLDAAGALQPGAGRKVQEALERAMKEQGTW